VSTQKSKKDAGPSALDAIANGLIAKQMNSGRQMGPVEFVENIVDAFDLTPFLSQRVLFKSIYGEELDNTVRYSLCGVIDGACTGSSCTVDHSMLFTEEELMDQWVANDKSNWRHPDVLHTEVNVLRLLEGKKTKKHFNYQNITFQAGMRCLSGSSYIFTESKGYQRLDEMLPTAVDGDVESKLVDRVQTRFGMKPVTDGLSRPERRVINLRTRYGYEIGGSEQHPLLVMDQTGALVWKLMPEIKVGDFLCIARNGVPFCSNEPEFEFQGRKIPAPILARILGLLIGDGALTRKSAVGLTTMDDSIRDEWVAFCETYVGKAPAENRKDNNRAADFKLNHTEFRTWMHEVLGMGYGDAYTKVVPACVRQGSKESVRQFLRGLYDTDGYATTDKTMVGYATASETLAKEVQILLTGFGIISSRKLHTLKYVRKSGELSTCWKIEINGADAIKFREVIGFGLERKQAVLDAYVAAPGHGSTVDTIPNLHPMLKDLKSRELYTEASRGSGRAALWGGIRKQCTNQTRRQNKEKAGGITYRLLPQVIDYFDGVAAAKPEVSYLRELQEQNLFFDEVVQLWDTHEPVYDICVPGPHEYVANGVVSHNSSKSASVALLCVYEFFKHITSDNPQKDLGVPKASSIYITVIASTEQQVKGTIFWYVREYITKSSFFKAKIETGEIEVTDLQIQCREKGVIIACGHSRATSIVGRTAVMVAFDELAMFSADDGHTSNAQDVYSRVGKSTATYKHHAKRIALSSVKCEGDFMETLVRDDWDRQAQGCLVFNLSTFDFNPLLDKDEAGIASDYAKDPASAARDYENVRPGTIGAFFIPEVVDRTCVKDPASVIMSQPEKIFRRRGEALSVDGQVLAHDSEDDVREMSGLQVAVTPVLSMLTETYGFCDIGLKHDSFGFAFGHVEWSEAGTRYVVDGVLEWRPRFLGKNKWALVDMVNSEEVILEVARKRNMTRLAYDQWNAASSVQRLFRENVITTQMPFSQPFQKKIYDNLRKKMNAGMVELPNLPVLIEELKNIELKNNESIQHPKSKDSTVIGHGKISKDLADVVAGVVWTLTQAFDADGALPLQNAVQAGPSSSSVYAVGHSQANLMQSKLKFFGTRG
jgi:intein/homing endonuclease